MDPEHEKLGRNEAIFRTTNDRLESLNESFAAVTETMTLVCECADLGCTEQIIVSVEEYRDLRSDPTLFAIKPDHVYPDVETVVSRNDRFWVIKKRPGGPAELAEALDADPERPA